MFMLVAASQTQVITAIDFRGERGCYFVFVYSNPVMGVHKYAGESEKTVGLANIVPLAPPKFLLPATGQRKGIAIELLTSQSLKLSICPRDQP